ncbi:P-loop ATPase, Sll1717 family [Metabacillus niabensis]|uniref:P-loop ATPase, Sll1717 family n=1 Tax=Metabacillus niabensis TaxID=324854 RepID=UPI001CFA0367|nr:hypothetical protein [Metabacillus niabensis]
MLENLSFQNDPFAKVNADEEERLEEYFIEPPFFKAVYGIPTDPKSYVVFAPRGGGKTALKRKIEFASQQSNDYLCVTYNNFEVAGKTLSDITLDYHLRNIIKLLLIGLIPNVEKIGSHKISKEDKQILFFMVKHYFSDIDSFQLRDAVESVKSHGQRAKEWWNRLTTPVGLITSAILTTFGLSAIEISQIQDREINLGTPSDQMKTVQRIAENLGFSSIYVLIDKVDENELTGAAHLSYAFIEPLLKNLAIFELKGFAFKLFLWDKIVGIIHQMKEDERIRLDRIQNRRLQWTPKQLIEMVSKRLLAFSEQKVSSLNQIFQPVEGIDWDQIVVTFGIGSPRNIIRLCKEIFEQQSEINSESDVISLGAINRGFKAFCENYTIGILPENIIQELLKTKRVDFPTNYISNDVFKFSQQAAISKIKTWLDSGVIEKIGETQVRAGNRPSNHYGVTNIITAKHIYSDLSVSEFIRDKVRYCKSCGTVLIREWNLRENYRCHECQEMN